MAFIADEVFDSGLDNLTGLSPTARIDINYTQEATTYTEAVTTFSCGNETGITIPAAAAGATDGRRVIVPAITAGDVTDDQTAGWWALTDGAAVLWATGPLTATQAVTSGNTFTLDAIEITYRDATAV
jgi:hypothetical protein